MDFLINQASLSYHESMEFKWSVHAGMLFKGFEPIFGTGSIVYTNGEEWDKRQRCLNKTLMGEELEDYFPTFVAIAQVCSYITSCTLLESNCMSISGRGLHRLHP